MDRPVIEQIRTRPQQALAPGHHVRVRVHRHGRIGHGYPTGGVDDGLDPRAREPLQRLESFPPSESRVSHVIRLIRGLRVAVGVDEHRDHEAQLDQIEQQRAFLGLERRHLVVAADHVGENLRNPAGRYHEVGQRSREVEDERAMDHVTEVDDPGEVSGLAENQVMGVKVAVDRLRAQRIESRQHGINAPAQHFHHERSLRRRQQVDKRQVLRRHAHVP